MNEYTKRRKLMDKEIERDHQDRLSVIRLFGEGKISKEQTELMMIEIHERPPSYKRVPRK